MYMEMSSDIQRANIAYQVDYITTKITVATKLSIGWYRR